MTQKPATAKARALLAKLQALAERGIDGEKKEAKRKLARLKRRYDFTAPDPQGPDLFAGVFIVDSVTAPILDFSPYDFDIANAVKWAIEHETGIPCLFRSGQLCARAETTTANRLHDIAATLYASFLKLWEQFKATPTITPQDRHNFVLGLYEGMMDEARTGEQLPQRAPMPKVRRAKRSAVGHVAGLAIHPYSVAVPLGKQIRLCVPIIDIEGELENAVKGELAA